jgi:hypothetical protein
MYFPLQGAPSKENKPTYAPSNPSPKMLLDQSIDVDLSWSDRYTDILVSKRGFGEKVILRSSDWKKMS